MTVLDRFRLDGETAIATASAEVGANVVIANRDGESGEEAAATTRSWRRTCPSPSR